MSQLDFDTEQAKQIEAVYRIRDAARRRRIVREALGAARGESILDVGCGPGFFCVELLEEVGPEGSVLGVDSSPAMIELAARRCAEQEAVEFRRADIVSLPVDDASFDRTLRVQVLEYVRDPTVALGEIHRALQPGGLPTSRPTPGSPSSSSSESVAPSTSRARSSASQRRSLPLEACEG